LARSTRVEANPAASAHFQEKWNPVFRPEMRTKMRKRKMLEHDREKWTPVFANDHAQAKSWTVIMIQSQAIVV
jgi:hypothetical protein